MTEASIAKNLLTKLWYLLPSGQRRNVSGLLTMMLVSTLLEVFGIGLIIPILAIMTQPDFLDRYPALLPWWQMIGSPSHSKLIMMGMITLVAAYAVKICFLAVVIWKQSRFAFSLQAQISKQLFAGYLKQPYSFHLQHNSAQLVRNVVTEVGMFTNMAVLPLLFLVTDGLVYISIAVLLFFVEPFGAICVFGVLSIAGLAFEHLTRNKLKDWGKTRQLHERARVQNLQQGFGGIKEVKLLGREEQLVTQFDVHNLGNVGVMHRQNVMRQMPRLWFELLAISSLATLVTVMLLGNQAPEDLLPTLGIFAAAAFRMMASANRTLSAIQSVRFSDAVISSLHQAFMQFQRNDEPPSEPMRFTERLDVRGLGFQYPQAHSLTLKDINFSIPWRTTVGFVGESGAGKSTLIDLLLGLLQPTFGTILVDSIDIRKNLRGWQSLIGYVPQSIYLSDDTLRRNIAYLIPDKEISNKAMMNAVRAAQLDGFIEGLPEGLDTIVGERGVRLSGGQRQRIGIARALYHDPEVLVLDEATSALDTETESAVMNAIIGLHGSKTILIIAHRTSTIEHCDMVFKIESGRLIVNE